jgi:hypothetical protein
MSLLPDEPGDWLSWLEGFLSGLVPHHLRGYCMLASLSWHYHQFNSLGQIEIVSLDFSLQTGIFGHFPRMSGSQQKPTTFRRPARHGWSKPGKWIVFGIRSRSVLRCQSSD